MWKKSDNEYPEPLGVSPLPGDLPVPSGREQAVIGPSIAIKGDLTGDEDLIIQGKVEGAIHLKNNNVTVGKNGRIKANIFAKGIKVEGEVNGDLFGEEQVVVAKTGHVLGNISAPKVALEEGCRFKGAIDMESRNSAQRNQPTQPQVSAENKFNQPGKTGAASNDKTKQNDQANKAGSLV